MAGLQRSAISFRRQGSSGSVWDDKFLSELEFTAQQQEKQQKQQEENLKQGLSAETELDSTTITNKQEEGEGDQLKRSKSDGGRRTPARGYRTVKVAEVEEPPSPKVAACGFCVFGRSPAKKGISKS